MKSESDYVQQRFCYCFLPRGSNSAPYRLPGLRGLLMSGDHFSGTGEPPSARQNYCRIQSLYGWLTLFTVKLNRDACCINESNTTALMAAVPSGGRLVAGPSPFFVGRGLIVPYMAAHKGQQRHPPVPPPPSHGCGRSIWTARLSDRRTKDFWYWPASVLLLKDAIYSPSALYWKQPISVWPHWTFVPPSRQLQVQQTISHGLVRGHGV